MPRRTSRGVLFTGAFLVAAACSTKGSNGTDTASVISQLGANDSTQAHDSAKAATDSGWHSLFDGKSTAGWHAYKGGPVPAAWKATDSALTVTPGGGDIATDGEYGDFELALEWKVQPGGNSGIFYRATDGAEAIYETAPEMQVLDDAKHPDGKNPLTSAGSDYGLYGPPRGVVKPAGQWNAVRVVARGPHVEHWLNGQKVVEYEQGSADWAAKVKASKFKDWPNYGKAMRGRIGLQDHGDTVSFRNIRIRELK